MHLVRFLDQSGELCFGQNYDGQSAELTMRRPSDGALLEQMVRGAGDRVAVKQLLSPIEPRAIICIGLNYEAHARETGAPIPDRPVVFMKNPGAVQHPGRPILLPPAMVEIPEVDYECELAVVIGRPARNVPEAEALDYVLGYTVANDVSARHCQKHGGGGQWVRGKSFDTFCPLGPVLVTPDTLSDPQQLTLQTTVNGRIMQQGHTSDMIFTVEQLIASLTDHTTLLPGTVILTGTPPGVGVARQPQVFLKPGDEVCCWIDGIGRLTNPVQQARD